MLDIKRLTLGEIDKIETLSGQAIDAIGNDGTPKGKMLAALAFVFKRREQLAQGLPPTFTWNEALDLTAGEANEILGISDDDEDEEPQPEKAKAPRKAPDPDPTPGE